MFTNLVESSADQKAFKRRSSFFLATVVSYALILFAAGVVAVMTYDAQVEAQTTEMLIDWVPLETRDPEGPRPATVVRQPKQANVPVDPNLTEAMRTNPESSTNDPRAVPDNVGVHGTGAPPWTGRVRRGPHNANPPSVGPNIEGCVICGGDQKKVVETEVAAVPPKPKPTIVRAPSSLILSKIISLPKPAYPEMPKRMGIQGAVNVQILIDESGKVISAQAVKGHALLTRAAEDAARRARFTPTRLGDQPVKVQGVITYNFLLQ
jgi:TonB family protein